MRSGGRNELGGRGGETTKAFGRRGFVTSEKQFRQSLRSGVFCDGLKNEKRENGVANSGVGEISAVWKRVKV